MVTEMRRSKRRPQAKQHKRKKMPLVEKSIFSGRQSVWFLSLGHLWTKVTNKLLASPQKGQISLEPT